MDQYLKPGASYNRLRSEYRKYGSLVIGYDFDNTVFDFHNIGERHEDVRQLLRDLKSINCKVICWTAQKDLTFVKQFLEENSIPCDGINTGSIELGFESVKPFFSALLDDRAGLRQVYTDLSRIVKDFYATAYLNEIENIK